ncbi:tRNA 2-selenouridine(34) synthase MnmH [Bacillus tuaregi]|uniref:tRNA 2-selenouridine(34) synthase MnmH n=1 Tax=Bacillus tuaregi TaxID=1816695 RepID=UPI000A038AFA|nr:tRNA 2-selenouridine(34) synthase MnmH [Bacillus tuaregi]
MKDITVKELLEMEQVVPVDVRSPGEFEEASIPGAVNIPLFSNEERKEVGTLYKQRGTQEAKWRAMEIVSPKLPEILGSVKKITEEHQPVLYCWRGGMRSASVASFLEFAGIDSVLRVSGGYRAYRQYILEKIPSLIPDQALVLHGMTGTGKTDILVRLQEKGYPVLDLEGMAAHRGSIFGSVGLAKDGNNQKVFDSLLFEGLRKLEGSAYFIVEAESKRIGKAGQPDALYEKKINGLNLYLQASMDTRVLRIYDEYVKPNENEQWFYDTILEKVSLLKKRLKNDEIYYSLLESTQNKQYQKVIRLLLEYYYDPRYQFKQNEYKNGFSDIIADDMESAIVEIEKYIERYFPKIERSGIETENANSLSS